MFRRKDEAYDPNDLLSEVMNDPSDDQALDTGFNDAPKEASAEKETKPQTASAPATAKPAAAPAATVASTPAPKPMAATAFRPAPAPAASVPAARPAAAPAPAAAEMRAPAAANSNSSKRVLTVGHDIHMKGEISTCDRLLIEGSVDATLKDVHTVELTQSGSFKGTAEIEDAEISGHFEGDLIVNGRLTIYATGVVSGNVAYGEIEIERGGKLTGSIKTAEQIKTEKGNLKKAA